MARSTKIDQDVLAQEKERAANRRAGYQLNLNAEEKTLLLAGAEKRGQKLAVYIREVALDAAESDTGKKIRRETEAA